MQELHFNSILAYTLRNALMDQHVNFCMAGKSLIMSVGDSKHSTETLLLLVFVGEDELPTTIKVPGHYFAWINGYMQCLTVLKRPPAG